MRLRAWVDGWEGVGRCGAAVIVPSLRGCGAAGLERDYIGARYGLDRDL